jgi:hypothetical protein
MMNKVSVAALFAAAVTATAKDPTSIASGSNASKEVIVQSCHFSITDRFGGAILMPRAENDFRFAGYSATVTVNGRLNQFGFSIACGDNVTSINVIAARYGATYDANKKKWVAYFGDVSTRDGEILRPATRVGALNAVNGHGFYLTQDDTDGDPLRRTRSLTYCLFHETKALCGHGQVMRLSDPKSDLLPNALTILRSIEFIDTLAPSATSAKPQG